VIDMPVREDALDPVDREQGIELGAAGDPPQLIEPREHGDDDCPCEVEGVDLLTPMCGCTPAGCSWDHCEESWHEVGDPLVIEGPAEPPVAFPADDAGYDVVLPPLYVFEGSEVAAVPAPMQLAETGAPADGCALIVVGAALVFGGAVVAVSRWIGVKR